MVCCCVCVVWGVVVRHLVHRPHEHLESDDGVDDDDKDDKEGDLHQRQQGHHYSVQNDLKERS